MSRSRQPELQLEEDAGDLQEEFRKQVRLNAIDPCPLGSVPAGLFGGIVYAMFAARRRGMFCNSKV